MTDVSTTSRELVLVLGVSGAGKNVALGAFEDAGFSVINNLPAPLLVEAVASLLEPSDARVAISINAQHGSFTTAFSHAFDEVSARYPGVAMQVLRLDADDMTLTKRFAETRRKHPFASDERTLLEAITEERHRIRSVAQQAFEMDTTATSAHVLRLRVREFARSLTKHDGQPLIVLSSFAYRTGIPGDADLVFDARVLPNPYYASGLAALTGRDAPVIAFLQERPETGALLQALETYLDATLDSFTRDNRTRVHIAIGCTGGQHRSVYVADALAVHLEARWRVLRHDREHPKLP